MVKNNKEAERHIQINFPDRDLEELAIEINDYVSLYFNNNYQFAKNVSEIKGQLPLMVIFSESFRPVFSSRS